MGELRGGKETRERMQVSHECKIILIWTFRLTNLEAVKNLLPNQHVLSLGKALESQCGQHKTSVQQNEGDGAIIVFVKLNIAGEHKPLYSYNFNIVLFLRSLDDQWLPSIPIADQWELPAVAGQDLALGTGPPPQPGVEQPGAPGQPQLQALDISLGTGTG